MTRMRCGVAGLLLFVAACATKPEPIAVAPSDVPPSALDSICARARHEGITGEVDVVKTTEPLITRESIVALADAAAYQGKDDPARIAAALTAKTQKLTVPISRKGCDFRVVDTVDDARNDTMVLQISAPILNPFVRGTAGFFARLSLGNEAAQWYWVPVSIREGTWYAGTPIILALRD